MSIDVIELFFQHINQPNPYDKQSPVKGLMYHLQIKWQAKLPANALCILLRNIFNTRIQSMN